VPGFFVLVIRAFDVRNCPESGYSATIAVTGFFWLKTDGPLPPPQAIS